MSIFKKLTPEEDAMAHAAMHLRMVLLGHTSYSGSVSHVDVGHARLLLECLHHHGFKLTPRALDENDLSRAG